MIRCGVVASPEHHQFVIEWAKGIEVQFSGLSARWFTLTGGEAILPPGSSFLANFEAMPLAFFDVLVLDPKIPPPLLEASRSALLDRAGPGAAVILTETHLATLDLCRQCAGSVERVPCLNDGERVIKVRISQAVPWLGLARWCERRADALAAVLQQDRSNLEPRLTRLDDLVLELTDTHADRLFGQLRRRVVDAIDEALPAGPWRAVVGPSSTGDSENPRLPTWDADGQQVGTERIVIAAQITRWLRRGDNIAILIRRFFDFDSEPPPRVAVYGDDNGFVAAAIIEACSDRLASVHHIEVSAGTLGRYVGVYRELRPIMRGRAFFRWLAEGDRAPDADLIILANPRLPLFKAAQRALDTRWQNGITVVAEGTGSCTAMEGKFGQPVLSEPQQRIAVYRHR